MTVLVIDVGGSHVKFRASGEADPRRFDSGDRLTPGGLVDRVRAETADWHYDVVSVGYPGVVGPDGPAADPGNLGPGWVGFDFAAGFGKPTRVVNDAALQALGGYAGGRMLFLGLGTGLGSALVAGRAVVPLELGRLKLGADTPLADRLGKAGLARLGDAAWSREVAEAAGQLRDALAADSVLLGGGNADRVDPLPEHCRRGGNEDALTGGVRLWEAVVEPPDRPAAAWRVVG